MNILFILIAILLFTLFIVIHELGHFVPAKFFKVKVNEFAIGMGPKIFSRQRGETMWSVRALPFGGFCSMEGEEEASDSEGSFEKKPAWQRMIIISCGALLNLLLGFILAFVLVVQQNSFVSTEIAGFQENAVSSHYGLKVNDRIKSINGYSVHSFQDIALPLITAKDLTIDIKVERDGGKEVELTGVKFGGIENSKGKEIINRDFTFKKVNKNIFTTVQYSFKMATSTIRTTWRSLCLLISGKMNILKESSGPIGIVAETSKIATESLKYGWVNALNSVLSIMMMVTASLGIFNLLPIPALDGSKLVFLTIEAIRKKPLSPKYEGIIHTVGFIVLLAFMVVVAFNDIIKLIFGG